MVHCPYLGSVTESSDWKRKTIAILSCAGDHTEVICTFVYDLKGCWMLEPPEGLLWVQENEERVISEETKGAFPVQLSWMEAGGDTSL